MTPAPAALHQQLAAALARQRAIEEAERRKVIYVPASGWYVDVATRRAAEWALREGAGLLGLNSVPGLRWFRLAQPGDRLEDWPGEAFRDEPGVVGRVRPHDPDTVWLNCVYGQYPRGAITPSLQAVVAHELQHVRDVLQGRAGYGREILERRARTVATWLEAGKPAPY